MNRGAVSQRRRKLKPGKSALNALGAGCKGISRLTAEGDWNDGPSGEATLHHGRGGRYGAGAVRCHSC